MCEPGFPHFSHVFVEEQVGSEDVRHQVEGLDGQHADQKVSLLVFQLGCCLNVVLSVLIDLIILEGHDINVHKNDEIYENKHDPQA